MNSANYTVNQWSHKVWEVNGARVEQMSDGLFHPSYLAKGYYSMVDGIQSFDTLDAAMSAATEAKTGYDAQVSIEISEDRQNKAFASSAGMMQTSTGEWVTSDDWDIIEGDS